MDVEIEKLPNKPVNDHSISNKLIDSKINKIFDKRTLPDFIETNKNALGGGAGGRSRGLVLALWNWAAAMIDTLVIIGSVLLVSSLISLSSYWPLYLKYMEVFFPVMGFAYIVMLRIIMGRSLGEWACGLRLGDYYQQQKNNYAFKVIVRSLLVFATGVILFPMISIFYKQDLAGKLIGLELKKT
jgi:hypothetical protein